MDKAMELATSWGAKLQGVLEQYGPKVADLALTLGQLAAIRELVIGALWLTVALTAGTVFFKVAMSLKNLERYQDVDAHCAGLLMSGFTTVVPTIISMHYLTNIYAWAGVFHPEVFLAAKALGWT